MSELISVLNDAKAIVKGGLEDLYDDSLAASLDYLSEGDMDNVTWQLNGQTLSEEVDRLLDMLVHVLDSVVE